ncbi:MAG: sulfoxide reductase heme-binding subunit YedZ [Alphaproteobacteria bacterium]|nr:sulfoxide reductase heme-binding subunit YedZ [Alphaproteobacteria bacterium]
MFPWHDTTGRVSPLKTVVFLALFAPFVWVVWGNYAGLMGPRPIDESIHEIGRWTIRLLFLALAVTPLRVLWNWPDALQLRRMIGVAAFAYAALHLVTYALDQKWNIAKVATEIVLRFYLTIGFVALLGLAALAVTSTDGWQRRLGGRRWTQLHRLVYPIALLAVIHHFLQSKLNVSEPTVMAGLLIWLMLYRVAAARGLRNRRPGWRLALLLAPVAALLTALGEALYFNLTVGAPPLLVLTADLSLDAGVRPAQVVLAITAVVALVAGLRRLTRLKAQARPA